MMDMQSFGLALGGIIGGVVSVIHAALMQRRIIDPSLEMLAAQAKTPAGTLRFIGPLLHVSSFAWFASGIALVLTALAMGSEAQLAIGSLVGPIYAHAAIVNYQGVRGWHPGWMLMGVAVMLIVWSLAGRLLS